MNFYFYSAREVFFFFYFYMTPLIYEYFSIMYIKEMVKQKRNSVSSLRSYIIQFDVHSVVCGSSATAAAVIASSPHVFITSDGDAVRCDKILLRLYFSSLLWCDDVSLYVTYYYCSVSKKKVESWKYKDEFRGMGNGSTFFFFFEWTFQLCLNRYILLLHNLNNLEIFILSYWNRGQSTERHTFFNNVAFTNPQKRTNK